MGNAENFQNAQTDYGPLTLRQAENIADLAARRAEERIYVEICRSVVRKILWTLGATAAFIAAWINGWFHFGPKS